MGCELERGGVEFGVRGFIWKRTRLQVEQGFDQLPVTRTRTCSDVHSRGQSWNLRPVHASCIREGLRRRSQSAWELSHRGHSRSSSARPEASREMKHVVVASLKIRRGERRWKRDGRALRSNSFRSFRCLTRRQPTSGGTLHLLRVLLQFARSHHLASFLRRRQHLTTNVSRIIDPNPSCRCQESISPLENQLSLDRVRSIRPTLLRKSKDFLGGQRSA